MIEVFAKMSIIREKHSIMHVWHGLKYASDSSLKCFNPLMPGGNKEITHT